MADSKITALTALTAADPANDMFPVVDVSDTTMAASGTTKRISINNILACSPSATLASATITGDLTVDTSTLKVDSTNNRVGILTASPAYDFDINGVANFKNAVVHLAGGNPIFARVGAADSFFYAGTTALTIRNNADTQSIFSLTPAGVFTFFDGAGGTRMTLNATGLGVGVAPSAWGSMRAVQVLGASFVGDVTINRARVISNAYYNGSDYVYLQNNFAGMYVQNAANGTHSWSIAPSGIAGNTITGANAFVQAMTLDASGNLLCGATTGTSHNLRKQGTTAEGDTHLNVGNAEHLFFACSSVTYNAAAAAYKITRNSSTLRSINAGGTINASGADYAEYMVKCSNFVLAKGDVAGIDANGKLTNVFADAVSFVVKSTDPSYVGNDKWGNDLEGDELEAARQLVDRIAFAGQVPVNVTGAKAGDYIIPVVDGTGIKGISVSNPTFDQYQLAVGKVIGIDADGRARIIVKVA
jgi:hypothetical protein